MRNFKTCTSCNGQPLETSNCCDAWFDDDIRICSDCKEHIGDNECPDCGGTGKEFNDSCSLEQEYKNRDYDKE